MKCEKCGEWCAPRAKTIIQQVIGGYTTPSVKLWLCDNCRGEFIIGLHIEK